jgi:hypothetical protein
LFLLLVFHKVLLVHKLQLSSESAVTLSVWSIGSSMLGFVGWFKSKRVREHIQGSSPFLCTDSWSFVREPLSMRPSHMPWWDFRPNSRKWISQQDCKLFKLK